MSDPITFGIAPEEPDTILIGSGCTIWGRIVGTPSQSAREGLRLLLASAAQGSSFPNGDSGEWWPTHLEAPK